MSGEPTVGDADGAELPTAAAIIIGSLVLESADAIIRLDCDGSDAVFIIASSSTDACWVCRRNAASPNNVSGESAGTSGASPSADGASPTADNIVDDNGVASDFGADSASGASCTLAVLSDVGADATSTDTLVGAGSVTDFVLGCLDVVVFVTDGPSLVSPPDGVLDTCRFSFFGASAAVDLSEPDFLSLTVAVVVDFLVPPLLPVSLGVPPPADAEDWEDSVAAGDEGDWVSETDDGPVVESDVDVEELDEEDESDDELVDVESVGPAHATPGALATATPTPKATAKPPTRPMYVAYPITTTSQSGRETAASAARTSSPVRAL